MKATPDSTPASVESVMALVFAYGAARVDVDRSNGASPQRACDNAIATIRAEVERLAQSAPLAQQREYPPLPKLPTITVLSELQSGTQEMVRLDVAHEAMRAYVDAALAAAQVDQHNYTRLSTPEGTHTEP